jgi:hypothetical protein
MRFRGIVGVLAIALVIASCGDGAKLANTKSDTKSARSTTTEDAGNLHRFWDGLGAGGQQAACGLASSDIENAAQTMLAVMPNTRMPNGGTYLARDVAEFLTQVCPSVATSTEPDSSAVSPTAVPPTTAPPTTAPPSAVSKVYSGRGDDVVTIEMPNPTDTFAIAAIGYSGADNFAVNSTDSTGNGGDLLVNTIGKYLGNVLLKPTSGGGTITTLRVSASGPWRIEIKPLSSARDIGQGAGGHGDDVVVYRGSSGVAAIHNAGEDNFAVWAYSGDSSDLLVNEIGNYDGRVPISAGPVVLEVTSNGSWSIGVSPS